MRNVLALTCVLMAAPVAAEDRLFTLSEATVIMGHSLDLASTQRCLGSGACHELNPYLGRFEHPLTFTVAKMGIALGGVLGVRKLHRSHPRVATVANYAIGSAFTSIAIRNTQKGTR